MGVEILKPKKESALHDSEGLIKSQHPFTAIIKLGKVFYFNSDCICLKEESGVHLGCLVRVNK